MNAALFTHCCHFDMFRNAGRPRASKQCSETSESMYVSQTFEERLCSMAPLWPCLVMLCRILGPRCWVAMEDGWGTRPASFRYQGCQGFHEAGSTWFNKPNEFLIMSIYIPTTSMYVLSSYLRFISIEINSAPSFLSWCAHLFWLHPLRVLPPRLRWILPRREQRCSSKPSLGAAWWPAYSMINPCNHEPLQPLHEQNTTWLNTTWNLCSVWIIFWIYCIHWI